MSIARAARFFAAIGAFFLLLSCSTVDRLQESAWDSRAASEVMQGATTVGVARRLFLPSDSDLILAGLVYLMVDPLAPNWEIETLRVSEDIFKMQLSMKRYHTGGAGEAQYIFRRNARRLARAAGYDDYVVLHYEEGIESGAFATRRFGEGEIRLVRNKG